jgi:hypothetical protein
MQTTFAEIAAEFDDIRAEAGRLQEAIAHYLSERPEPNSLAAWMDLHVFASATEKVYTGCERVMARIAALIDGAPLDRGEGWHLALLQRMANPYADIRPAVISDPCLTALNRLRAFRHRERNSYGLRLNLDIVLQRAQEVAPALSLFHDEVLAMVVALNPTDKPIHPP